MLGTGIDIRQVGSGNPGFNNVLRVNKARAVIALIGDLGKGVLAIWLFHKAGDPAAVGWLYGFAAVLGHCYSPFLKFSGGKGIATSAGVMLVLYPFWAGICVPVYVIGRLVGKWFKWKEAGAIASVGSWVFFVVAMIIRLQLTDATYAAIMTLFLAWRHKKNFQNMFAGAGPGLPA